MEAKSESTTSANPKPSSLFKGFPKGQNKKWIIIAVAIVVVAISCICLFRPSKGSARVVTEDPMEDSMVAAEEMPVYSALEMDENDAKNRYEAQLRELEGIADIVVKYTDGRYIWYNLTTPDGYSTSLSVYDSETDNTSRININKTSMSDDEVTVHSISEHNAKITIVLEEHRNSNGWVEGTYVWTIDCSNRNWKCIADGVAGAEIINNGSAVKITTVTILNPDEPTFAQEYKESNKTINL